MRMRATIACLAFLAFISSVFVSPVFVSPVFGEPLVDVGIVELLPDMANQPVVFTVSGGDSDIQGLNFYIQVADGGPEAAAVIPGIEGIDGPTIQSIDLIHGTIFDPDNLGQTAAGQPGIVQFNGATTVTPTNKNVTADGVLATVVFDTTGFPSGQWDLRVSGVAGGAFNSSFAPNSGIFRNGTLVIVPEPNAIVLLIAALAAGLTGIAIGRRRR